MRKQITADSKGRPYFMEMVPVPKPESKTLTERAGAAAAVVFLALLAVIVIGLLVWAAEIVWSAVL